MLLRRIAIALATAVVVAYWVRTRASEAPAMTPATAPPAAPPSERAPTLADSARVRQAQAALAAYLEASREATRDPAALDTLGGCGTWDGEILPITMLARYALLAPSIRGDTVIGRAAVVTVAEQSADRRNPGRYLSRFRVRTDTIEYDVIPNADDARWYVCNGLRFGYHGPDSLSTWRPAMASYGMARAIADSLGRMR